MYPACVLARSVSLYACVPTSVGLGVRVRFRVSSRGPGHVIATFTSRLPMGLSACPPREGRGGERGESLHLSTHPAPTPLPQSRDRTLFRVAIRHLFSNLISSELYFPSLRKIIFHRSRSRPLPRSARRRRRLHISARRAGRAAARAEARGAPRRSRGRRRRKRRRLRRPAARAPAAPRPRPAPGPPRPASLPARLSPRLPVPARPLSPGPRPSLRLRVSPPLSLPLRPPGPRASSPLAPVPAPQDAAGAMAAGSQL